jgi:GNAT superfamily N-acetyltransferase
LKIRAASDADVGGVTTVLTAAFEGDPLWRWAFEDLDSLTVLWRFYVESALRYRSVSVAGDFAAVSIWIPPGGSELTEEEEQRLEPLIRSLAGPRAPDILELLERFEASHPSEPPHYYLTLLGTAPSHRGQGLGMALLAENLRRFDGEGVPTYLESSNPANDRRYQAVGYEPAGSFTTPQGEHTVTTMWRAPR